MPANEIVETVSSEKREGSARRVGRTRPTTPPFVPRRTPARANRWLTRSILFAMFLDRPRPSAAAINSTKATEEVELVGPRSALDLISRHERVSSPCGGSSEDAIDWGRPYLMSDLPPGAHRWTAAIVGHADARPVARPRLPRCLRFVPGRKPNCVKSQTGWDRVLAVRAFRGQRSFESRFPFKNIWGRFSGRK